MFDRALLSAERDAALRRVEALEKRQEELLATIRKLSSEIPYAEESGNAAVLIAEVGTLRARIAEIQRGCDCCNGDCRRPM